MDRGDEDLVAAKTVKDDVGSAADDEFAHGRPAGRVAEVGMKAQGLDDRDDAHGELFGGARFVEGNVGANLTQAGGGEGRPDYFQRAGVAGVARRRHGKSS